MAHTYEELKTKKVDDLREIAKELDHEAVKGYTQLTKAKLLEAICTALGLDTHEHHEVVGIDKASVKARIHALKAKRDEILASSNRDGLKQVLRDIHRMKRKIRKATV
ncbi:MAG: Rho termination factor N-terminal domain-containing protein [Arenicellales bacterium]|nr:Rho termination factor N-terminal domain-containing protein [Arenicellales bacterium]